MLASAAHLNTSLSPFATGIFKAHFKRLPYLLLMAAEHTHTHIWMYVYVYQGQYCLYVHVYACIYVHVYRYCICLADVVDLATDGDFLTLMEFVTLSFLQGCFICIYLYKSLIVYIIYTLYKRYIHVHVLVHNYTWCLLMCVCLSIVPLFDSQLSPRA